MESAKENAREVERERASAPEWLGRWWVRVWVWVGGWLGVVQGGRVRLQRYFDGLGWLFTWRKRGDVVAHLQVVVKC